MILAGDIGGTKTNVGLFELKDDVLTLRRVESFPSRGYPSLDAIVEEFLGGAPPRIGSACFGVAGPVVDRQAVTPNLPWVVSVRSLGKVLGLDDVGLINDLEATAHGLPELKPEEFTCLNKGVPREGNGALVAAGTGFGMASLFWDGSRHIPSASEGGHADFAPRNDLEIDLLRYLQKRIGRVSVERVLSGPGLRNIYDFLRSVNWAEENPEVAARFEGGDPSSIIANAALAGESDLCAKALDMFARLYGAMAGNFALILKAVNGVYVGGGIAPKIIRKLTDGVFMDGFKDKGRLASLLSEIPVHVIMNDKTALLGAARVASRESIAR